MRRADRLLQIIQIFRRRKGPVKAKRIALELEVSKRTVYRDIASLIGSGVPIRGEAGVGYVLEKGYDLPPLMFSVDELEALVLGARLVSSQGDRALVRSAADVIAKIASVIPTPLRPALLESSLFVPGFGDKICDNVDVGVVRTAIRLRRKLRVVYCDAKERSTERLIWPIAVAYYHGVRSVAAWCELRTSFRNFRVDRVVTLALSEERVPERYDVLLDRWQKVEVEKYDDFVLVDHNN